MKRSLCLFLTLLLAQPLWGCASQPHDVRETVSFYYPLDRFSYGEADGVMAAEHREADGHMEDLDFLLNMYLRGPADEALVNPFPAGVKLVTTQWEEDTLTVTLSDHLAALTGMELTVACACLTRTCLALTGAARITVMAESEALDGAKSITMDESTLLLFDGTAAEAE